MEIATSRFNDMISEDMTYGSGVGCDVGSIYNPPFTPLADAAIGLAVLNAPGMGMGDAVDIRMTVNLGFALNMMVAGCNLVAAADLHDLTRTHHANGDWGKRLHLGVEVRLPMVFAGRLGVHQGYMTAGATITIGLMAIDLTTYGQEIGAYAGQREDRRYLGQVSAGW